MDGNSTICFDVVIGAVVVVIFVGTVCELTDWQRKTMEAAKTKVTVMDGKIVGILQGGFRG